MFGKIRDLEVEVLDLKFQYIAILSVSENMLSLLYEVLFESHGDMLISSIRFLQFQMH